MEFKDECERMIAEQAVLGFRAVQAAASKAVWGHGMEAMEDATLAVCREHGRRLLQEAAAARVGIEKKKGPTARVADDGPISNESRPDH